MATLLLLTTIFLVQSTPATLFKKIHLDVGQSLKAIFLIALNAISVSFV